MGRSNAYWTSNLYVNEAEEPVPTAPLNDLPATTAGRFRALRAGLLGIEGASEQVRFMGPTWQWAWEYGIGNRNCGVAFQRGGVESLYHVESEEVASPRSPDSRRVWQARSPRGPAPAGKVVLAGGMTPRGRTLFLTWCDARRNGSWNGPTTFRAHLGRRLLGPKRSKPMNSPEYDCRLASERGLDFARVTTVGDGRFFSRLVNRFFFTTGLFISGDCD